MKKNMEEQLVVAPETEGPKVRPQPEKSAETSKDRSGGGREKPGLKGEGDIPELETPEEIRIQRAIDQAIELLPRGKILFHPKERMKVGETELVEVIITRETSEKMVAELAEKMAGEGKVETREIPISYEMCAELKGGDAFDIDPRTTAKKIVPAPPDNATWRWDVTPLERGTHVLELWVIATIRAESEEKPYEYPVFERDITVEVSPRAWFMDFVSNNWQWIITTVMIPVGGWYLSRKVKKKNLPPKDGSEGS